MKALATRIPCIELSISGREIAALMRHVAAAGYRVGDHQLDAEECLEVAELIIRESLRLNRSLDMRLLVNGFADRLQADDEDSGCTWQDLVMSQLRGRPSVADDVRPVGIRTQNKCRELQVARQILTMPPEKRLEEWTRLTGKSRSALYRRIAELGAADACDLGM
jgi:hypothetical protein